MRFSPVRFTKGTVLYPQHTKLKNANVYYTCTYAPNSNSIFYHTAITFLLIFLLAFGAVAYMFILSSRYMSTIVSVLNTETVPEENTKSKLSFIVKNVMKIQAKNKEMEKRPCKQYKSD